ncbi:hypothetical protein X772_33080 [Mesorhizobium sp. LSJC280B00]|nr:hypothetical protein X772_33080 [Mesorhizobium sp. LSJC280B00]
MKSKQWSNAGLTLAGKLELGDWRQRGGTIVSYGNSPSESLPKTKMLRCEARLAFALQMPHPNRFRRFCRFQV